MDEQLFRGNRRQRTSIGNKALHREPEKRLMVSLGFYLPVVKAGASHRPVPPLKVGWDAIIAILVVLAHLEVIVHAVGFVICPRSIHATVV